jgi:hypothetical protein
VEVFSDRLTVDARRDTPFLASRIEYDPLLPAAHSLLLRRMLSGSIVRGITIYDEPFWRNDGLSGMSVAPCRFRSRSINRLARAIPAFSPVTCSDRKQSGLQRWIPRNDATFGCAHWRCGTDPKRYRQGPIWKPIGQRNNGRLAA